MTFFRIRYANILVFIFAMLLSSTTCAQNQTDTLSPVHTEDSLPFHISVSLTRFQLPVGLHSGAVGTTQDYWIFIAGRTNGLHNFNVTGNFPPQYQNRVVYALNGHTGAVSARALTDASAKLTQQQIDWLSVSDPQFYQENQTLYISGGYGIETASGVFTTKPVLTAINLPGLLAWVLHPEKNNVASNIQQLVHPVFQVAGGKMAKLGNTSILVMGQNYRGQYHPNVNGVYNEQVRRFVINQGTRLSVTVLPAFPSTANPNFRRRDINIVPALLTLRNRLTQGFTAYAGVFTPSGGVWTVPVIIDENAVPFMPNPQANTTFKQAMNHYNCATVGLYSRSSNMHYHIFFGGMSYGYFQDGQFVTDTEVPFLSQVTAVTVDPHLQFKQYLLSAQFPTITTNAVPYPYFGSGAYFLGVPGVQHYANRTVNLDNIRQPTVIGYIVGGIMSQVQNTTDPFTQTQASPYIFKVTLIPK